MVNMTGCACFKAGLGLTEVTGPLFPTCLSTEELEGIAPSPKEAKIPKETKTTTSPEDEPAPQSPCEEIPVEPPAEATPSESSESISLVTQIANPAAVPEAPELPKDLSQKLFEASLEEQSLAEDEGETGPPPPSKPLTPAGRASGPEPRPPARVETLREEVPTDLRVFELNSDSGKSTPSNNGKKGRSGGLSASGWMSGQARAATRGVDVPVSSKQSLGADNLLL